MVRPPGTLNLLLIDDDEDDYVELRALLSEIPGSAYKLTWKNSYADGLISLSSRTFDACLLDFRLGGQTGLELMRESQKTGFHCPIIVLTGHGDIDVDMQALETGAADYLVKGQISPQLLDRSLRYSIKHAKDMAELASGKQNFHTLFNSTFEGILVYRDGAIIDANAAACEIFGRASKDLVGTELFTHIQEEDRPALMQLIVGGNGIQIEGMGVRGGGELVPLGFLSRKVNLQGQQVSLLAVRDLTQRKQMEAVILQQDRLASLGLLASSLAHEIGTPLGVVRGRAEMVARTGDGKLKSVMELMITQIDRVSKLVSSLLHLARGGQSGSAVDVAVLPALGDVIGLLKHEAERKRVEFEVNLPADLCVLAEEGPLEQVFLNILVNSLHAIDASIAGGKAGPHRIRIQAEAIDGWVRLSISDSGVGISGTNLKRLFQPFFTTKEVGKGTGLGLAITLNLIQSWGGTIWAESVSGQGATFHLKLRLASKHHQVPREHILPAVTSHTAARGKS